MGKGAAGAMGRVSNQRVSNGAAYNNTGILPPLGTNHRYRLRRFIISPYDPCYRAWKSFLAVFVLYTAWAAPFEFGFLNEPRRPLSIIDNVVNGFFFLDIILTFFVAYVEATTYQLVDDPEKIAKRYAFSLRMWFDIISSLPSELVEKIFPHVYGLHSMLRLWRLSIVGSIFSSLEEDRRLNYIGVRCFKLILVTLFYVHISGCIYFHIAASNHDPKNTWIGLSTIGDNFLQVSIWTQYAVSVYWAISTLSTVGYRDPVNRTEMVYSIIYILLSMGLLGYLVGSMTNLLAHSSVKTRLHRESIQAVSNFALRNQLPYRLQEQMVAHVLLKYKMNSEGIQQQEILDSFPKAIRSNISHYLFYSLMDKVYLFHGVSNDLLFQLLSEMKVEFYSPNEDIILQNETPTDFYVIVSGAVDIIQIHNGVEQVLREAKEGDLFGEISVLCNKPRNLFTVRTKGLCQMLRLNRNTFMSIVKASVGEGTIIMNNLLRYLKDLQMGNPVMEKILVETENMLTNGRLDLINLSFAAMRNDHSLMQLLLKRGLYPNESDETGRTPLHIVASNGSDKCVHVLLENNANPNSRDQDGRTPLWEAMLGGHEKVIKLLRDYHADINAGDIGQFTCIAAQHNNLDLLRRIVQIGGDVTRPSVHDYSHESATTPGEINAGDTALHIAVCRGYVNVVKYLVEQGCDIDRPNASGHSPRELAHQLQDRQEIKSLFQSN